MTDVSVVIPARDAAATLAATLRAVAAQRFDGAHEVVVVDDRSRDDTAAIARAGGARVLQTSGATGPSEARNLGVRAGAGGLIAFTDADCEPHPDWLARGTAPLRAGADLVQGPILPVPGVDIGPFDRTLRIEGPSPLFETANLLVTRDAFERAGGFRHHAELPGPGLRGGPSEKSFGEDALFGWTARRAGAAMAFEPEAVVYHAVFSRTAGAFVAEHLRRRFFPALVHDVPELRDHLPGRYFLSRRSAAFDAALLAATGVALARHPLPAAAALPYAVLALRARRPRRIVAEVAADAVSCGALVAGSLSARTPVL